LNSPREPSLTGTITGGHGERQALTQCGTNWCRDVPQCEEGHTPMNTGVSAAAANVTVFAVTKYEQLVPRPKGPPGWQSSAGLREWASRDRGMPAQDSAHPAAGVVEDPHPRGLAGPL